MAKKRRKKTLENNESISKNNDKKNEMFNKFKSELETKYWKWVILKADGDSIKIPTYSTKILTLDKILWGGIPKWRIVEIYWEESSGKTTFCLHLIWQIQKQWGLAWFVDFEQAINLDWAKHLWVNLDNLALVQPDYWEQWWEVLIEMTASWLFDVIVVDSVAAMIPKAELEGDVEDHWMGLQARMMWKILRKLSPIASKTWTTVIFINQTRQKIWVLYWNPETTPWGNALKFFASQRIKISKKDKINDKKKWEIWYNMKFLTVKNKITSPKKETLVKFTYENWFDYLEDLINYLTNIWIIKKAWAFLSIEIDGKEYKAQWIEKFKQLILDNNLEEKLFEIWYNAKSERNMETNEELNEYDNSEEILKDVE